MEYLLIRCRHVIWYMKSEDVVEPNKGTSVSLKGIWIRTHKKLDVQLMLLAICLIRELLRGSFCKGGVQPVARRQHTLQGISECGPAQMCVLKALEESFCNDFPDSSARLSHMNFVLTTQCCNVLGSDSLNCWRVMLFGTTDSQGSITAEACVSLVGTQGWRKGTLISQDKGQYHELEVWSVNVNWF